MLFATPYLDKVNPPSDVLYKRYRLTKEQIFEDITNILCLNKV